MMSEIKYVPGTTTTRAGSKSFMVGLFTGLAAGIMAVLSLRAFESDDPGFGYMTAIGSIVIVVAAFIEALRMHRRERS
ncbi:hypothetical protein GCM10027403_07130 [Arthrobacter tecti]